MAPLDLTVENVDRHKSLQGPLWKEEWKNTGVQDWLRLVETKGAWRRYTKTLAENFISIQQIEERFVTSGPHGLRLDPQFFKAIGVEDAQHQLLFEEYFTKSSGSAGSGSSPQRLRHRRHSNIPGRRHGGNVRDTSRDTNGSYCSPTDGQSHGTQTDSHSSPIDGPSHPTTSGTATSSSHSHSGSSGRSRERRVTSSSGQDSSSGMRPQDLSRLSLADWLLEVDCHERLLIYLPILEENYDSIEQVIEVYVPADTEEGVLDYRFFEDVGIKDLEHQKIFERWFSDEFGTGASGPTVRNTESSEQSFQSSTPPSPRTPQDWRRVSVEAWLHSIDESFPATYLQVVEEKYSSVEHFITACVHSGPDGHSLDESFFNAVCIEDPRHRELFKEWVSREYDCRVESPERQCGLKSPSAGALLARVPEGDESLSSPKEDRTQPFKTQSQNRSAMSCAEWLRHVQTQGAWTRYIEALKNKFESVRQIEECYMEETDCGRSLSTRFFVDLGVEDVEHQQLFRAWFARQSKSPFDQHEEAQISEWLHNVSCNEWLKLVEGAAARRKYCKALAANFTSVKQIEERFVIFGTTEITIDPAFFAVLGVDNPDHRKMFQHWFRKNAQSAAKVKDEGSSVPLDESRIETGQTAYVDEPEQEPVRSFHR